MTLEQALSTISALTPAEQLRVVQMIWDGLPANTGTDISSDQQAELDRRWAAYLADPSSALSEEEFRAQIRNARK